MYVQPKIMLTLTLRKRLLLFLCIFIVCFFMVGVVAALISLKFAGSTPATRIEILFQDIVMFVIPPLVTALLVTRQPASLLCIDVKPQWAMLLVAIATMIASIPAMDYIITLNQNLPLPKDIADTLRMYEESAESSIQTVFGTRNLPNMIMSILIVGVMAGFSEEMLFRGGLQRLLSTGGVNIHTAIWLSAAIFSLLHMQFYGFVPRMLLGAFFGYTLYWTRSLWVPIILHTINNTVVVVSEWYDNEKSMSPTDLSIGDMDLFAVIMSSILVVAGLTVLHKMAAKWGYIAS